MNTKSNVNNQKKARGIKAEIKLFLLAMAVISVVSYMAMLHIETQEREKWEEQIKIEQQIKETTRSYKMYLMHNK